MKAPRTATAAASPPVPALPPERCLAKTRKLPNDRTTRGRTVEDHCRIAGAVALSCVLVLAAQTSCLALVLPASFSYLGEKDLARLLVGTTLVSAAVLFVAGVVGWLWLSRRLGVKGGRT